VQRVSGVCENFFGLRRKEAQEELGENIQERSMFFWGGRVPKKKKNSFQRKRSLQGNQDRVAPRRGKLGNIPLARSLIIGGDLRGEGGCGVARGAGRFYYVQKFFYSKQEGMHPEYGFFKVRRVSGEL